MAERLNLPIETLPSKTVHTRKSGSGAYRTRAVVCGNYETQQAGLESYAGGADAVQIRTMVRCSALHGWKMASTDIRVAFLNAPKRDKSKITVMEVPTIFKKLGLASADQVWIIDKAVYGLTTSPRDWGVHRDDTLPKLTWRRFSNGRQVVGHFQKTADDHIWRLMETTEDGGDPVWKGLMSVYVDDILIAADKEVVEAALGEVRNQWALAETTWASEGVPLKYCGFEIEAAAKDDGFIVSQKLYEREVLQRWKVDSGVAYPLFKVGENDDDPEYEVDQNMIREAQALTGSLLWLATRTRADISFAVATMGRLSTKNPLKTIEIGRVVLQYLYQNPGGTHYSSTVPGGSWGGRNHLKVKRHERLLETFSDIAYGAGSKYKSVQGIIVYWAGVAVAWQSSQQPFVTHSTSEAELVSYCEALIAGRSVEACIKEMTGVSDDSYYEKVMYGDNMSAIALAHGTANSSWRTRHLRIRSVILREALSDDQSVPGGGWKLLHLSGSELVSDGLTKPLTGLKFENFRQDLGYRLKERSVPMERTGQVSGGGTNATSMMVLGSMMLATAKAQETEEDDPTLFVLGACLMAIGVLSITAIAMKAMSCCVRSMMTCATSSSSGLADDSESMSSRSGSAAASQSMSSRSGSVAASQSMSSRSGSAVASRRMSPRSGFAAASLNMSSSSGSAAAPLSMPSSSGSAVASQGMSSNSSASGVRESGSGSVGPGELTSREVQTDQQEVPASTTSSTSSSVPNGNENDMEVVSVVSSASARLRNPWNIFQQQNRGRGWSPGKMSREYAKTKRPKK